MPIKHAAFKAWRKSKKARTRNIAVKETIKKLVKQARGLITEKNKKDQAKEAVFRAIKTLDKSVRAGILKQNTAARLKSRLMKRLNAILKK